MCPPLVCECAAHDEFYQACPCVILQVTSAGGGLVVWGGEPGNEATWWFVVVFSTRASEPHYQGSTHGLQSYTDEDHTHYINFSIEH